jgi:formylglycine-generating enzyme required for sulfatase activity
VRELPGDGGGAGGIVHDGSPDGEKDRHPWEGPQHTVTINRPFAVGKLHVTRDQFAVFVKETGSKSTKWLNPGFEQDGSHPVVNVTWDEAKAYADWLAAKTGKPYRLLSEAEWEYAARARTSPGAYPRFWFGYDKKDICWYANSETSSCNDGYNYTSPAGHYEPNGFGLYDMAGNAWQWTEDCWHDNYNGAPADGSAWTTGCQENRRVVRGGSWADFPAHLRAADRDSDTVATRKIGFRLARTLAPTVVADGAALKRRIADWGYTVFRSSSPAEFAAFFADYTQKWGKVIREEKIRAE